MSPSDEHVANGSTLAHILGSSEKQCIQISQIRNTGRQHQVPQYPLRPEDGEFARAELKRLIATILMRKAGETETKKSIDTNVLPGFVKTSEGRPRIAVEYIRVKGYLEDRAFHMEKFTYMAPSLPRNDCLLKADVKDCYYHLRVRNSTNRSLISDLDHPCTFRRTSNVS